MGGCFPAHDSFHHNNLRPPANQSAPSPSPARFALPAEFLARTVLGNARLKWARARPIGGPRA